MLNANYDELVKSRNWKRSKLQLSEIIQSEFADFRTFHETSKYKVL